jgi:arsenical pump membrane protein
MQPSFFLAVVVSLATVVLVIWRPRNLNVGIAALLGAVAALVLRLVSVSDIWVVTQMVWNATAALIGIVLISAVLDQAGFFEWAALHVARRAGGSGTRLFVSVIILAAAVSTFFTNDGTILILTPIIYETMRKLRFPATAILGFLFACGFIADTVSTPLIVSNLVNIISADYFQIPFPRYMVLMILPSLVSLIVSTLVLLLIYKKYLPAHFSDTELASPKDAIRDPVLFRMGVIVVSLLVPAFFIGAAWNVPVSLLVGIAAFILLVTGHRRRVFRAVTLIKSAPWHVILFALGMYLVVYGLRNAGLVTMLASGITTIAQNSLTRAIYATGIIAALLSSVMNNLPATMVGILTVDSLTAYPEWQEMLALANVIGCDLGPKMTPIGSLATLLWLHELGKRGVTVDWRYYLKIGMWATPPVLISALIALALVASLAMRG